MAKLILYNDKINSFIKIKAALIRFCNYSSIEAEQSTLIAHDNGKVLIKEGDFLDLLVIKNNLELYNVKTKLIK